MASADISPGTLLLVERRYLPMPTAIDCGLAGGVGQVRRGRRLSLPLPGREEEARCPCFFVVYVVVVCLPWH